MERLRRGGRHATARTSELPLSRRSDASTPGIGLRQTSGCMKRSSPAPGDDAATRNALLIVSPLLLALVFVAQSAWGGREGVARTESHGTDTEWTWTQMMTALATTGTDQLKLPVALQLARGRRSFETFVVMFTYLASATYHFCDAFDTSLGLTELQWHRLDNVSFGALLCPANVFGRLAVAPTHTIAWQFNPSSGWFHCMGFVNGHRAWRVGSWNDAGWPADEFPGGGALSARACTLECAVHSVAGRCVLHTLSCPLDSCVLWACQVDHAGGSARRAWLLRRGWGLRCCRVCHGTR